MRALIIIVSLLFFTGCIENKFDATPVEDMANVTIHISDELDGFGQDPFRIISITPIERKLLITVEYTGGCLPHHFDIVWNGSWERGVFLKAKLNIFHSNNGDACEGSIRQVLEVDLKSIFDDQYIEKDTYMVVKNGFNKREISIHPVLAEIVQGKECHIKTSIENSLCGQGIWQNNWLLMADSLGFDQAVWLQPVRYLPEVPAAIPEKGVHYVGIKLLFGYESPSDPNCLSIPEGVVIPVEINCISSSNNQ